MTRDITVGAVSLTYLGLNDYSGKLDKYAKKKKKARQLILSIFIGLEKLQLFFSKTGLLLNVYS